MIVTKTKDSKENLCDTCTKCIADCDVDKGVIEYGDAVGNDNVIACDVYNLKKMFYFGCKDRIGHGMYCSSNTQADEDFRCNFTFENPWSIKIDGALCPKTTEHEGAAKISYKDGWTALSFWDRSVDYRYGSNSNFLIEGNFNFENMIKLSKIFFQEIMNRFKFEITEYNKE